MRGYVVNVKPKVVDITTLRVMGAPVVSVDQKQKLHDRRETRNRLELPPIQA